MTQKPSAQFKSVPEDFIVEEVPAYLPSGEGEHLYVKFEKRQLTTEQAVGQLARLLDVNPRDASWAGLKDKQAITTQTASFLFPKARTVPAAASLDQPGLRVLEILRHGNKLKPGHLKGNRFRVTLRDLSSTDTETVRKALTLAADQGVPNRFGEQRFGRDNVAAAHRMLSAKRIDRGRRPRLLMSALQSEGFNRVLEARVADGTWNKTLAGDIAKKEDSGALFLVEGTEVEVEEAAARSARQEISPTGPMFGVSMRWPAGSILDLEKRVLDELLPNHEELLPRAARLGEGTRRALRMKVEDLNFDQTADGLVVSFFLTKGSYATTVLESACSLNFAAEAPSMAPPDETPDAAED